MKSVEYMFKRDGFTYRTTTDGWEVTYEKIIPNEFELNGDPKIKIFKATIKYEHIPRNSVNEFIEGYIRCYALQEGWI